MPLKRFIDRQTAEMNRFNEFHLLLTVVMLAGCTPRLVYLQDEYSGFIRQLSTARGSTIEIAGRTYRIVRPTKEALAVQNLLLSLRIKEASFHDTTVSDALVILDRLQKECNQGVAVPIVFEELPGRTYTINRLTFRIRDASLMEVLAIICAETRLSLGMKGKSAVLFYGEEFFHKRLIGVGDADSDGG